MKDFDRVITDYVRLRAKVTPAHTVLVHGASGAVGVASVQIAKRHLGAKVIGTAGTPGGLDVVRQAGADLAVCHRDKDYLKAVMVNIAAIENSDLRLPKGLNEEESRVRSKPAERGTSLRNSFRRRFVKSIAFCSRSHMFKRFSCM